MKQITTTVTISGTLYRITGEVHQAIRGELSEPGAQRGEDEPGFAKVTRVRIFLVAIACFKDLDTGLILGSIMEQFEYALLTASSEHLNEPNE